MYEQVSNIDKHMALHHNYDMYIVQGSYNHINFFQIFKLIIMTMSGKIGLIARMLVNLLRMLFNFRESLKSKFIKCE